MGSSFQVYPCLCSVNFSFSSKKMSQMPHAKTKKAWLLGRQDRHSVVAQLSNSKLTSWVAA